MLSPHSRLVVVLLLLSCSAFVHGDTVGVDSVSWVIYPNVNDIRPDLPSPFLDENNVEYVVAVTKGNKYAVVPVTLGNDRDFGPQLLVDSEDFPALAATGLHSEAELDKLKTITGRSLAEITELGRPGGLSEDGFMAEDEDILSVIKGDNRLVRQLGLTHPRLAKPLFHVLNLMEADLALDRWNMAKHRWEHITALHYNGRKVFVEAGDTKGGQKSIFDDNIEGGFHIKLWREPDEAELKLLKKNYGHLPPEDFDRFVQLLSFINTGEMEPQYIMRYGFYEGHTGWRADPIAIAFIFGLKSLPEIEDAFEGDLHAVLTTRFKE